METNKDIREFLSKAGSIGGKKSKRILTPEESQAMNKIKKRKVEEDICVRCLEPIVHINLRAYMKNMCVNCYKETHKTYVGFGNRQKNEEY